MDSSPCPSRTPLEALGVIVICFGYFVANSIAAVMSDFPVSDHFNDASFAWLIAAELGLASVALAFLRARRYPIARLRPQLSWSGCAWGVAVLMAALLAWAMVGQSFSQAEFQRQPIAEMASQAHVSLPMAVVVSLVNGLYEETFLAGYLIDAFRNAGASLALGLSVLVRISYHLYQGPIGAVSVMVFGLVVGIFYWRTGKLWPIAFAHALADAMAFA